MKPDSNNEALILQAAEEEFLEKGYAGAKTMAIAKKAGVTHTMLHYYFRTKENLFQMVFQEKVQIIASTFEKIFDGKGTFEIVVRNFIERHFDFIAQNPRLISFVFHEMLSNEKSRLIILDFLQPKLESILCRLEKLILREVLKRKIRPVTSAELLMNIISMNVITFMVYPVLKEIIPGGKSKYPDKFLKERKKNNVRFILNALKI
jgi:AcrR family transcriptional regulator